jgi:hypothetical protein
LNDNFCPFKKIIPSDTPVSLLPSNNTANFKRIVLNIHNPVLLRLLLCKEEKINSIDCPFPEHKNPEAVNIACNSQDELAHIYIRHEEIDSIARSCIIFFINSIYLFTHDGLLKLFKNTVNWLNIAEEKPYFYVILRYNENKAITNTDFNRRVLNIELRKIYKNYSNDEDICVFFPADKYTELLRIEHTDKSKKFDIKPR